MYLLSFFFAFLSAIELDSLQILYTFWELFAPTENLGYWNTFWSSSLHKIMKYVSKMDREESVCTNNDIILFETKIGVFLSIWI